MISQHPARRAVVAFALVAFLLVAPGCLFSPDSKGGGECTDCREPPRNSVQGAIQLFAFVWEQRRLDLYEQLLHAAYEYIPQDEDAADFPWITPDDPWERTDELGMAANMFNPEFISDETGDAVDSIEMALVIVDERTVQEGVEVTTNAAIQVLWAEGTGARSDVIFRFTVVEDPDEPGLFQILRQVEEPATGGG